MFKLNLLIIICLMVFVLTGCSALKSAVKESGVNVSDVTSTAKSVKDLTAVIPNPPPLILLDSGQDKSKFPANTQWIKPPKIDSKSGRAYLSLSDMEKISRALSEWPQWYADVKGAVEGFKLGKPAAGETGKWYEIWKR